MVNSSTPWAAYCALIAFNLVEMDKRTGASSLDIGETLQRSLAKIILMGLGNRQRPPVITPKYEKALSLELRGRTHYVEQRR